MIAYVLFFLTGLGFGYAALGAWKWLPLAFPTVLALATLLRDGFDGAVVLRLIVALVITAAGVLLGTLLEGRRERREPAGAPS